MIPTSGCVLTACSRQFAGRIVCRNRSHVLKGAQGMGEQRGAVNVATEHPGLPVCIRVQFGSPLANAFARSVSARRSTRAATSASKAQRWASHGFVAGRRRWPGAGGARCACPSAQVWASVFRCTTTSPHAVTNALLSPRHPCRQPGDGVARTGPWPLLAVFRSLALRGRLH